jgi:hypothetical protein
MSTLTFATKHPKFAIKYPEHPLDKKSQIISPNYYTKNAIHGTFPLPLGVPQNIISITSQVNLNKITLPPKKAICTNITYTSQNLTGFSHSSEFSHTIAMHH